MKEPRLWTGGVDAAFPSPERETRDWLHCNACAHPQQVSTLVATRRDVREKYASGPQTLGLDGVSGPSGWEMRRMARMGGPMVVVRVPVAAGWEFYRGKRGVEWCVGLVCGTGLSISCAGVGWWKGKEGCSMQLCTSNCVKSVR